MADGSLKYSNISKVSQKISKSQQHCCTVLSLSTYCLLLLESIGASVSLTHQKEDEEEEERGTDREKADSVQIRPYDVVYRRLQGAFRGIETIIFATKNAVVGNF